MFFATGLHAVWTTFALRKTKKRKTMCNHEHEHEEGIAVWAMALSAVMLAAGLAIGYLSTLWEQYPAAALLYYVVAFAPVGLPVMKEACESVAKGDFTSEFMLMSIATLGAFAIGEYPEAVAVMLLYAIGEALQDHAVDKARDNIKSLMAFRPDKARRRGADGHWQEVEPSQVSVGDELEVRPGERVPLDGVLLATEGRQMGVAFNTSALTGESVPRLIDCGGEVLAGMIATDSAAYLRVIRPMHESAVSRILTMVEEATEKKSATEQFIHRFAHYYTPTVVGLALLAVVLPWLFSLARPSFCFEWATWINRALVFLVISCPCALVISVPLSYFAGIGAASKRGILFKGGNYIDGMTQIDTVVFDKTGTLTTGNFAVQEVVGLSAADVQAISRIELGSSHPIAKAIVAYCPVEDVIDARNVPGYGLINDDWAVGTLRLLDREGIAYPDSLRQIPETIVACAYRGAYKGYLLLADTLKTDAEAAIRGIEARTVVLSGDKQSLVSKLVKQLGVDEGHGDLLPQDKLAFIERLKSEGRHVAFVGDGINDAPSLAVSSVGIAMGALGADMAIETADVIVQTDQPSKVAEAMAIGRRVRRIVCQNIGFAIGVKLLVMGLGVAGVATLWEAVFADTGVALIAVANAMRIFLHR